MKKNIIISFVIILIAIPATIYANSLPLNLKPYIKQVGLVGGGILKIMIWDIYYVQLFAPQGVYSSEKAAALVYNYRRDVSGKEITDASCSEMYRLGMKDKKILSSWCQQLLDIVPDVYEGSTLTALYIPGKKTLFFNDNKSIGVINDKDFGKYFFDIWLSPQTKEPELRQRLLGKDSASQ